jgi:hypothetical protein
VRLNWQRIPLKPCAGAPSHPTPVVGMQTKLEKRQAVAIGIALQTQVMKACPIHRHLYFDDDVNPAGAFALAIELIRAHRPFVQDFEDDEHALIDLLSDTLSVAPMCCPVCHTAKPN